LITDFVAGGAPGVVVMSTNYNSDDAPFTTKRQMENSEYAVSVKPTLGIMHMIECDPKQTSINELYVRVGNTPTGLDKKTTDLGNFQIATQGNPVQLLGELWVTYCVEFFKPELPTAALGFTSHITRFSVASLTADFGTTLTSNLGSINSTPAAGAILYFGLYPSTNYLFTYKLTSTQALTALPVLAAGPGTFVAGFATVAGAANAVIAPAPGAIGQTEYVTERIARSDATGAIVINVTTGTFGVAANVGYDIYLSTIQQTVN